MRLLGQKYRLDVGENAALCNRDARQQSVQLLVVADSQLQVSGDDPRLFVVPRRVSCQLEHLSSQILHDCPQVDRSSSPDASSIVSFAQMSVDASNWELKSRSRRSSLRLLASLASFTTTSHFRTLNEFKSECQSLWKSSLLYRNERATSHVVVPRCWHARVSVEERDLPRS